MTSRAAMKGFVLAISLAFVCAAVIGTARADDPKPAADAGGLKKSGTVEIAEYEIGIGIADNIWGHGQVTALGKTRKFKLSGLGLGGAGGAKISAYGTVYNLTDFGLFPGVFSEGGAGAVAGKDGKTTILWLRNTNGVVMELRAKQEGLALTGGANGILVQLED